MQHSKLFTSLFVSASIFALAACGGGGSDPTKTTTGAAAPASAASTASDAGIAGIPSSTPASVGATVPASPVTPVTTTPASPVTPSTPVTPSNPTVPVTPVTPVTPTVPVTPVTPTTPTAAAIPFYGINGHYVQGGLSQTVPLSTQAASLADLGVRSFRQDMYSTQDIDTIASTVIPGLGANVQVLPCIIPYPWNDPSLNGSTPTEASAYAYAYTIAAHAATAFKGIPVVEFGNEYDIDSHNAAIANDGQNVTDFDNNTWPIWRGSLRGSADGWHSVDTQHTTKIMATAAAGWTRVGWVAGMLNGTQPDGTSGHQKVVTDIINWHWYQDGGDFENAIGNQGTYNTLAQLHTLFNLPIMFTEIGSSPDQSTAAQQAYITKTIPELVAAKAAYNVIGAEWYELYDYPNDAFGVMTSATAKKATYSTLKSAIAASPVQ